MAKTRNKTINRVEQSAPQHDNPLAPSGLDIQSIVAQAVSAALAALSAGQSPARPTATLMGAPVTRTVSRVWELQQTDKSKSKVKIVGEDREGNATERDGTAFLTPAVRSYLKPALASRRPVIQLAVCDATGQPTDTRLTFTLTEAASGTLHYACDDASIPIAFDDDGCSVIVNVEPYAGLYLAARQFTRIGNAG